MKPNKLFLLLLVLLSGCFPNMTPDKSVLSSFKMGDVVVEHFNHSSAYAETPDYITVSRGKIIDTICISTNIAVVTKNPDSAVITIGFYGIPKFYTNTIQIPESVFEYKIAIDTSYKKKTSLKLK